MRTIITSGLRKAIQSLERKENALRFKFREREHRFRDRIDRIKDKLFNANAEIKYLRLENRRQRRAIHYLEGINGGANLKQKAKVEKLLGIPPHITRAEDWHKVKAGGWEYLS